MRFGEEALRVFEKPAGALDRVFCDRAMQAAPVREGREICIRAEMHPRRVGGGC